MKKVYIKFVDHMKVAEELFQNSLLQYRTFFIFKSVAFEKFYAWIDNNEVFKKQLGRTRDKFLE